MLEIARHQVRDSRRGRDFHENLIVRIGKSQAQRLRDHQQAARTNLIEQRLNEVGLELEPGSQQDFLVFGENPRVEGQGELTARDLAQDLAWVAVAVAVSCGRSLR